MSAVAPRRTVGAAPGARRVVAPSRRPEPVPPPLRVVPARRPLAGAAAIVVVVVFVAMLGLTVFQTRMAQQQVRIDQLEAGVDDAREAREALLRRRAELRAPQRLAEAALALGMKQADAVNFVEVEPDLYAEVLAASGPLPATEPDATELDGDG
jgi:hypothetical protein